MSELVEWWIGEFTNPPIPQFTNYMPSYWGPPPPSGGTQSMI
jgi:hypothetical protein